MIESIHLQNFQCHRDRTIEFDQQLNVLIGETDAGKSSALRGLIWVLLNQPRGDGFISHGEDFALNSLKVDGHEISRGRRKSYNYYTLDDRDPYEAIGTGVPDDVAKLLAVDPISIQRQLDPPFWFLLSPGEVSKELNAIVNLELIDEVLSFFTSRQKKSKLAISLSEERLEKTRSKRKELEWTEALDLRLDDLEEKERQLNKLEAKIQSLTSTLDYLEHIDENVSTTQWQLQQVERVVGLGEELKEQESRYTALQSILQDVYHNKSRVADLQKKLDDVNKKVRDGTNGYCPICGGELEDGT